MMLAAPLELKAGVNATWECGRITSYKKLLARIMRWKISIGKARPLMRYVYEMSESEIESAFRDACRAINRRGARVSEVVNILSVLRGVACMTASAILSVLAPHFCCFASDEIMDHFVECGNLMPTKSKYTMEVLIGVYGVLSEVMGKTCTLSLDDAQRALFAAVVVYRLRAFGVPC